LLENLGGNALPLANEAEKDVLGTDVVVTELQCLAKTQLENLLGTWGKRDVTGGRLLALADDLDDFLAHRSEVYVETFESLGSDALTLVEKTEQDVLGTYVVVVEEPSFFLGKNYDPSRSICKPLKHF
jgi:hypothetical protein